MRVLPPLGLKNMQELVDYIGDHEVPTDGNPDLMTMPALKSAAYAYDEVLFTRAAPGAHREARLAVEARARRLSTIGRDRLLADRRRCRGGCSEPRCSAW